MCVNLSRTCILASIVCVLMTHAVWPQGLPQATALGIVNAASYAPPPVSPGSLASIFGSDLTVAAASAQQTPLPTDLAGTSVTVNGSLAPLLYVSPTQINFQIPSSLDSSPFEYTQASIVVTTAAGSSAPVEIPVYYTSPSLFSDDGSGFGQAAALNVSTDGTVSLNSPMNSAAPGDFISLFGTGFGLQSGSPGPSVILGGSPLQSLNYAGLAPTLVGVDQINLQIPPGIQEACAVPITVEADGLVGPTLSVSIHSGRGQCVDPPTQSYGTVTLTKTVTSTTGGTTDSEVLTASFPSGPGITPPQAPMPSLPDSYSIGLLPSSLSRSCPLVGETQLSAGNLTVQSATSGKSFTAPPLTGVSGAQYQQALPSGFISSGEYPISASGGPVTFSGTLTIPAPIQIQSTFAPGTQISEAQPLTINWTGGTAGDLVKVSLLSSEDLVSSAYAYSYMDAGAGSFTFYPICTFNPDSTLGTGGEFCTLSLPASANASVIVEYSGASSATNVQGVTGPVQLGWVYRFVYSGLSLSD
jgi:uncharacterized protein (TIGR03437 family)